ncbi:MAG: methyltransferase domain-containing protein [Pseudomonadota bacterium]
MTKKFLDKAYDLDGTEATQALYAEWSASYDAEVTENGYATPKRCAEALAQFAHLNKPMLDFGCGTGLSGLAMRAVGFSNIDGIDINPEMVKKARSKGAYNALEVLEPGALPEKTYPAVAAIGVIGAGAAPVETMDLIWEALEPGGHLVFSFNDHALEDPVFEGKVEAYTQSGKAKQVFREYGPHLPGIDLNSVVYVLEKM